LSSSFEKILFLGAAKTLSDHCLHRLSSEFLEQLSQKSRGTPLNSALLIQMRSCLVPIEVETEIKKYS